MESAGGWRWKTSAELAYVRAALGLKATRRNLTLGVSVNG